MTVPSSKKKRFWFSYSLILSLVLLNAVTWVAVGWSIQVASGYEYSDARNDARSAAAIFAEQATRVFRSIDASLRTAAYELQWNQTPDRIKELVDANALSMDYLVQLTLVDNQGKAIGNEIGPDPTRTDVSDREHIRVHLDGQVDGLFIGKPVLGRLSQKWSIQLTRALHKPDGALAGVLVGSLDPFYFSRFWTSLEGESEITVSLIGTDRVLRTSSRDIERKLAQGAADANILSYIQNANSGASPSGDKEIVAVMPVGQSPLYAVAQVAPEALTARIDKLRRSYIQVGLIISLIVNVSVFFSARSLAVARGHEQAAKKAQERLQQAIESMSDGFVLYDDNDRLITSNNAYKSIFPELRDMIRPGTKFSEIADRVHQMGGHGGVPGTFMKWLDQRASGASLDRAPIEYRFPDGRWIRIYDRRTADGGSVGIRADVTEMKKREEELIASQALLEHQAEEMRKLAETAQRADLAKSSFVAAVSHELRTPLNAILGFSNLLQETTLDGEQQRYVHTLQASARHLAQIVNDILDFTRIEAGHLEIQPVLFQLKDLIATIEEISKPLIGERPIAFRAQIDPDTPATLLGDLRRITQILINLVGNAVKFTEAGEIALSVDVASRAPDIHHVRFVVTDTGRGISPDAMKLLFAPFQQGDATENLRASGTGLGLVISRGLARLMNGDLTADSEVGNGSRFTLTIPLGVREPARPALMAPRAEKPKASTNAPPLNVLVADDAEPSRMLCGFLLKKRGHAATLVENGEKALAAADEQNFDLILMDVEMPGIGGREAVERIRALHAPSSKSYIVALTAQAFEHQVAAMKSAGCNEVLIKPFEIDDFDALLTRIHPA